MIAKTVHLGFEVGTGAPVAVPIAHMAVTGQTQQSGKTTTLEALVSRSGKTALTFITKRGERCFEDGRRIQPYFRDRADWQFVSSILDATLQEKNKFLRPWIIKICRHTESLADVQREVRKALETAKGIHHGVYTQLEAYLDLIVPEIRRARLADTLDLQAGLNVMDVSSFDTPMQMLFVQSAIDWVNEREKNTILVVPEAWEFIPEGKGSPVKASAIALVRKGATLGNFIWVDSQDMAGVDKTILRGCTVWLIGVQREANEIKRSLANIPAGVAKPKAGDVALLEKGQFFACHGRHVVKTYVQPAWCPEKQARDAATGDMGIPMIFESREALRKFKEDQVDEKEARALREENKALKHELQLARSDVERGKERIAALEGERNRAAAGVVAPKAVFDIDLFFPEILRRLREQDPATLKLAIAKPEIEVAVKRRTIQMDGDGYKGRIARLLADGFYDQGASNGATRTELKRTGKDMDNRSIGRWLDELTSMGFFTRDGSSYLAVPGMKVNVVEG